MKRILIIDDEEIIVRSLSKLLEKKGYEVYSTKSGADALILSEEEDFDLIISDIRMPGKNGVDLCRELQTNLAHTNKKKIPIIFITGFADESLEKQAQTLAPVAYIHKPFDVFEMLTIIEKATR